MGGAQAGAVDSYCMNELEAKLTVTVWKRMDLVHFEVPSGPVACGSVMQWCLLTEKQMCWSGGETEAASVSRAVRNQNGKKAFLEVVI